MKDPFGFIAPFYDYFLGSKFRQDLAKLLKLPAKGFLLDAGGGTGRVSVHFQSLAKKVVVCDLSFPMLLQASHKGSIIALQTCAERLPFEDNTFDRILVVDALHHFYDQRQAISEMIRVLKPKGRMVIEEPDINLFAVKMVALAERFLRMKSRFLSKSEITRIISENGLNPRTERTRNFRTWIVVNK
jgi:demethylmenaquinone methyltransferase/2-methoxy-6-polyprenyl-1,4-benzoquinol methylase